MRNSNSRSAAMQAYLPWRVTLASQLIILASYTHTPKVCAAHLNRYVVVTFQRWLQNSVKLPLMYGRSKLGASRMPSRAVVSSAKQSVAPPKNMHVMSMYSQYTARRGNH